METKFQNPYFTVVEAADFMRISPRTVRYKINEGEIKHIRIGRRVLLRRVDIVRFMEEKIVA